MTNKPRMALVPVEATDEMYVAGLHEEDHGVAYKTMLAASPTGGKVSREMLHMAIIAASNAEPNAASITRAVIEALGLEVEK